MLHYHVSFASPWYLLLLLLLPVIWWFSYRKLSPLGPVRRWIVLAIRTTIILLIVLALAEIQMVRTSDRLTVIYLLDQSLSIPEAQRRAMIDYVNAATLKHREHEDRVGVIVFGRDAAIEIPPFNDDVQLAPVVESLLDPHYTNLAGALKLAKASFPEDAAKRVVLVSDGNENLGSVVQQAKTALAAGIGIDVMPIRYDTRSEVVLDRLAIPSDVRRGQTFDMKLVATNTSPKPVPGRLRIAQLRHGQSEVIAEQKVELPPGKKVYSLPRRIDAPDFYTYEARFIPDNPDDDLIPQNNRATAFTQVRGKGRVLLIEDCEHPGEFSHLAERLKSLGLEVTVQRTDQLFNSLAELLAFDTVILANVPRVTDEQTSFSDDQIAMLVRNTQEFGAGLVVLGGPNSFGTGGWVGTELEKAMPVDFQIKSAKVVPVGALALVIDRSGSMSGEKLEQCKAAAIAAVKTLGARDFVGVVTFDSAANWDVPMMRVDSGGKIIRRIQKIGSGGGTNMYPGMTFGHRGLRGVVAGAKHMIVLSDGQTEGQGYSALAAQIRKDNITISSVAIGPDADVTLMSHIAQSGGGKFYRVKNPKILPRIFMREARRVARPLIWDKHPVAPRIAFPHEMLSGVNDPLPPIRGFVMTTKKDNPLVEVSLVSPEPSGQNNTVLASWTYGLGKAVAFTTDAGARWTTDWLSTDTYDRLFGQMVRWSMRPSGNSGKFTVAADIGSEKVRLVVTALDKDDEFLNFLNMAGSAVGPDLKPIPFAMEQVSPGRYVGEFPAIAAGSYFVVVSHGVPGLAPILSGINVPYSDEFRIRTPNDALLEQLVKMTPAGGKPGQLIDVTASADPSQPVAEDPLMKFNPFRHGELPKATSSQDIWYFVILVGSVLFFFDVFFRRVQVSFAWVPVWTGWARDRLLRRERTPEALPTMERLRSRKAEVSGQIDQRKAEARFEPTAVGPAHDEALEEPNRPIHEAPRPSTIKPAEEKPEEESYTERLLKAKRKAWKKGSE